MGAKNLLVELLVEELPPKALKQLGEAFAALLADSLKAQGLVPADAVVTAYATPRRLGGACGARRAACRRPAGVAQADAGVGGAGRRRPLDTGAAEEAGRSGRRRTSNRRNCGGRAMARPRPSSSTAACPVPLLPKGCRGRWTRRIARLPIPKVMSYQLADGWTQRAVRAPGAWSGGAARGRRRAGRGPGPAGAAQYPRPSLRGRDRAAAAARRRQLCAAAASAKVR